jgi:iron complex outermembrane recepter protein
MRIVIPAAVATLFINGAWAAAFQSPSARADAGAQMQGFELEEVIVTAQKRAERLQDVPVPVTAISADALANTNQVRILDYYTSVPGLSLTAGDSHGSAQLVIRGLTTGGQINPTVGIVVDDVPYGSSQYAGYVAPDIDPSDLARVEVLRGPQGTLYGASSIGGLLKFVTIEPSIDRVEGRVQVGTSSVANGDGLGYSFRGSVNVPLGETFALRASGLVRQDPGYIDDPSLGIDGVNSTDVEGGRLAALWRPSDSLSLKLSALIQHSQAHGSPLVDRQPDLGDLQHRMARGTGAATTDTQVFSANLTARLGSVDLTSVTGYSINELSDRRDLQGFAPLSEMQFGVSGTVNPNDFKTEKLTQEVRLSAPLGENIDWLFGGFYAHEDTSQDQKIFAVDSATGAVVGSWLDSTAPLTYVEYAAFADITFHLTDRFDIQVGGRESQNRQTYSLSYAGPFAPVLLGAPSPVVTPEASSKENSFTYLVTPQFKVSPNLMLYSRLASGYRPGGPNAVPLAGALPHYRPDTTQNYELGIKGDVLDHVLSFDASLYYIDWKDIQLLIVTPSGVGYTANGSRAKSQGVELSLDLRPLDGLKVSAWGVWSDAVLTDPFPPLSAAYGLSGDRLPYSSRVSGNLSVDQEFTLTGSVSGFVGGSVSYVGSRVGGFASVNSGSPARQDLPAYTKIDLRAGMTYDAWTVNVFVNNVADKRGIIEGGIGTGLPFSFFYIQPRTIGLSLVREF